MRQGIKSLCVLLCLLPLVPAASTPALAHGGAPLIVVAGERVGPYTVTMWADPDVGEGTFTIDATVDGGPLPAGTSAVIWVEPADGHLGVHQYPAEPEMTPDGERLVATVPFDAEGEWSVRLVLDGPAGSGETTLSVRVTPQGTTSPLLAVLCLVPFVIVGALWLVGIRRQASQV